MEEGYLACWRGLRLTGEQWLQQVHNIQGSKPAHRIITEEAFQDASRLSQATGNRGSVKSTNELI